MAIRLYLSSQGLGDNPELLRPMDASKNQALIVLNALDPYPNARQGALPNEMADLATLGYQSQELDLRNHFHRSTDNHQLNERKTQARAVLLANTDLIWVAGGNTFTLARAMDQSHFKEALMSASTSIHHTMTFGGYSAGAVVTGPDLQGIHLMDDPNVHPDLYDPEAQASALHFTDVRIVPHFQSASQESENADRAVAFLKQKSMKYRTLCDGEVWITEH